MDEKFSPLEVLDKITNFECKMIYEVKYGDAGCSQKYVYNTIGELFPEEFKLIKEALASLNLVIDPLEKLCNLAKTNDIDEMVDIIEKKMKVLNILKEGHSELDKENPDWETKYFHEFQYMCNDEEEDLVYEELL